MILRLRLSVGARREPYLLPLRSRIATAMGY